jgi:hypothetical protein
VKLIVEGELWETDDEVVTLLHLCGCTDEAAVDLLRAILPKAEWATTPIIEVTAVEAAVRANPEGAAQVIVQWADALGLLDHGSSHRFSWMTPHGHEAVLYLHEGDE